MFLISDKGSGSKKVDAQNKKDLQDYHANSLLPPLQSRDRRASQMRGESPRKSILHAPGSPRSLPRDPRKSILLAPDSPRRSLSLTEMHETPQQQVKLSAQNDQTTDPGSPRVRSMQRAITEPIKMPSPPSPLIGGLSPDLGPSPPTKKRMKVNKKEKTNNAHMNLGQALDYYNFSDRLSSPRSSVARAQPPPVFDLNTPLDVNSPRQKVAPRVSARGDPHQASPRFLGLANAALPGLRRRLSDSSEAQPVERISDITSNGPEMAKIWKENERLKQKLKEQTALVHRLQKQLTAMLQNNGSKKGNALVEEAGNQMLKKLHSEGSVERARCLMEKCAMIIHDHHKRNQKAAFKSWVGVVEEQNQGRAIVDPWLVMTQLQGVRNAFANAAMVACFDIWNQMVREKRRLRSNPYIEANADQNASTMHLLRGMHDIVQCAVGQTEHLHDCILSLAVDICDAAFGYLYLVDSVTGSLHLTSTSSSKSQFETHKVQMNQEGILASVASKQCVYACGDMTTSTLYSPVLDRPPGLTLTNMLVYPLVDGNATFDAVVHDQLTESVIMPRQTQNGPGRMYAVLLLANKNLKHGTHFDADDICNLQTVLHSCGDIFRAHEKFVDESVRVDKLQQLLNIVSFDARDINLGFISDRVKEVAKAQRSTIFVIDDVMHELYFVIDTAGGKKEIRMPLTGKSMAGASILDNQLINIPDCYQDPRFDPAMDKKTGFKTTQMLCVPISTSTGEVIGAIQVINTDHGMSFTEADVETIRAFRVYVQIAILNKKAATAEAHAIELAKKAISIGTQMSFTKKPQELVEMYFREMCRATDADYISLTMPQAKSTEELLLRYDNQADRPYPVPLQRDTGTYMCSIAHRFINVSITGQGGDGKLYCVDNYKSVPRKWLDALPDSIEPRCEQALQGQCRLKTHNDFDKQRFEDEWWKNMLLIPVVTQQGTYVLTVAGKKGTQCFSILDEELLVLSGQQFCHMVAQYDLMDHLEGILDIMSVDASAIDLGFLSEKVVQLTKAARGAIFVIDECTVPGAPYEHELYFVIDTPVGKKEIRMPLTGKANPNPDPNSNLNPDPNRMPSSNPVFLPPV